jgi:iron complex transport system ATP-binding protein
MPLTINNYSDGILHDVTFEVEKGENLILLGANGVGKTTLAKVLCGLLPSDAVNIDGMIPSQTYGEERAKRINYIPAKMEVFDSYLSVEEFLALSHFNTEISIDEALLKLNISHLKIHSCQTLSSGESQLVLTASALLHGAVYTLFDEPTANLDPTRMKMLFALLKNDTSLPSKIIITHNLDLAYRLGFDVLYLKEGQIAFHGTSKAFFDQTHLDTLYGGSVQKINDHVVVAL